MGMSPRDATLTSLLAYGGLRPDEATAARWEPATKRPQPLAPLTVETIRAGPQRSQPFCASSDCCVNIVARSGSALIADRREALDLLEDFCGRFYWIKDHPDYQANVREFLTARGREPRPLG